MAEISARKIKKEKPKIVKTFGMVGVREEKPEHGTVEEETAAEMEEFRLAGKPRTGLDQIKKAEAQYRAAVETEFWFAVVFQSRAQKDAFLAATGWSDLGTKHMDGLDLAERLGVKLPEEKGNLIGLEVKAPLRELAMKPGKGYKP